MRPLSESVVVMKQSGIRRMQALALGIPDAIHLEIGEPDFATPAHIVEAAHQATLAGFTKYTIGAGLPELREAISDKLARRNGLGISPDRVVVTTGSSGALVTVFRVLLDPGDEVLLPDPGWANYVSVVKCAYGVPRFYELEPKRGFEPILDCLAELVTPRTKAIMINSPSNPTGAVLSPGSLRGLVAFAEAHDLYVVSDEVYEDCIFDGDLLSPMALGGTDRHIGIYSVSKSYAMTGWRVGYVVTPAHMAAPLAKLQEPYVASTCAIAQKAAEAALRGPQDCVESMRLAYKHRRDLAVDLLREYDVPHFRPSGAFYVMIDTSGANPDSDAFAEALLLQRHVSVCPGSAFGQVAAGWVRVSLATAEPLLLEGLSRLAQFSRERQS
jgi:aspartate aminotransferase/aminotransferase